MYLLNEEHNTNWHLLSIYYKPETVLNPINTLTHLNSQNSLWVLNALMTPFIDQETSIERLNKLSKMHQVAKWQNCNENPKQTPAFKF